MEPTLKDGEVVLVNRLSYLYQSPQKGDIVACKNPNDGKILIKRIDRVEESKYFVVGDNAKDSRDSRGFGMIDKNKIIGKVMSRQ